MCIVSYTKLKGTNVRQNQLLPYKLYENSLVSLNWQNTLCTYLYSNNHICLSIWTKIFSNKHFKL